MPRPIVAALIAFMLPATALAQQTPAPPPAARPAQPPASIVAEPAAMLIAACDSDGDARTTMAELDACLARSFAAAEGSGGGSIGYISYGDWSLKWLGDRNALPSPFIVDSNNDDRITLGELQAAFALLFARFDTDKDGAATRAELLTIATGLRDLGRRGALPKPPRQP